ncbi:N-acetylglucosamine-6-phosphate deacetylase [Bryobacter aggregatus]|uniref:N-acetylglucosamine-6-phosphate deacetylase n=1 Tax=Bryobacter aggregatus TaxID=360054 RepID=UPI0004E27A9F|nr:amidohydrolase family protein [Bryobacter aggregatus]
MSTKCFGFDYRTGDAVRVDFAAAIESVSELFPVPEGIDTWIAPAFIDLQVNGFAGVDYCSPHSSLEEIARSIREQFATGVARLYPTVITGSEADMQGALRNLARAKRELPEGEAFEAIHAEGPFISAEDGPRGAHPRLQARAPHIEEWRRMQDAAEGHIRLLTLSPEYEGSAKFIEEVVSSGVVVSIGHTKATREQILDAVSAGATMSTHLGNGAHAVLPRHPNYIWEQLAEDRLTASFIVDGIHLPPSFLKVALRAKGIERSVIVTDAVMPAGCAPGDYRLGEVEVTLHPGDKVTLRDGNRLAGSALKMHVGVSNLMRLGGLTLREAVTMATTNAARAGRVGSRIRGLNPGDRGDLIEFRLNHTTKEITILRTWLSGRLVYENPN